MTTWEDLLAGLIRGGAVAVPGRTPLGIARYADPQSEYDALGAGPAVVYRADRALLEVTGKDRAAWLHNLTTNQIKTLGPGDGVYAFVLNVQGRILFDVNVIVHPESLWVDLDRVFLETARKHFSKYIITEDVRVTDLTDRFVRLAICGREAVGVLTALGASNVAAMGALGLSRIEFQGTEVPLIRHDFCGPFGVELLVSAAIAGDLWRRLTEPSGPHRAVPVGEEAVQVRRIEARIPWPGCEITSEYLPAETRQLDRAVSYQKGCYLGQEVVERMRSRHVVARQLVQLQIEGGTIPPPGSQLFSADPQPVGQVTSSCHSPVRGAVTALGYVRTAQSNPGTTLFVALGEERVTATVTEPASGGR